MRKSSLPLLTLTGLMMAAATTSTVAFADTPSTSTTTVSSTNLQNQANQWDNLIHGSKVIYIQNPANESGAISNEEQAFIASLPQNDQALARDFISSRANHSAAAFLKGTEGQRFISFLQANPMFVKGLIENSDASNPAFIQSQIKVNAGEKTTYVFPDGSETFVSVQNNSQNTVGNQLMQPASTTSTSPTTTTFDYQSTDGIDYWYNNLVATWTMSSGLIINVSNYYPEAGSFGIGISTSSNGDTSLTGNNTVAPAEKGSFSVDVDTIAWTNVLELTWSEGSPVGILLSGKGGNVEKVY